jgi:hypothetical protein
MTQTVVIPQRTASNAEVTAAHFHQIMVHIVTAYDRKESKKGCYNRNALSMYLGAVQKTCSELAANPSRLTRDIIIENFNGRLCDAILRGLAFKAQSAAELRTGIADPQQPISSVKITPTKRGFEISRASCPVCGEPPFGGEYCCGHAQRPLAKGDKVMSKETGWTGTVIGTIGRDMVRVAFAFATANGGTRKMTSPWRVEDLTLHT